MIYDTICLSTAIVKHGASSTVHIYAQKCGPCPVFAGFTLAFALQLRKKHGKTSVRVGERASIHITKTHTLQNPHIHTHPHIAEPTHIHTPHIIKSTHTLQNPHIHTCPHITKSIHIHTHTHITKSTHTHTHTLQHRFLCRGDNNRSACSHKTPAA